MHINLHIVIKPEAWRTYHNDLYLDASTTDRSMKTYILKTQLDYVFLVDFQSYEVKKIDPIIWKCGNTT